MPFLNGQLLRYKQLDAGQPSKIGAFPKKKYRKNCSQARLFILCWITRSQMIDRQAIESARLTSISSVTTFSPALNGSH